MGRACSTHGRGEMRIEIWSEILQVSFHLEDLSVDGMIISERILEK
jgi:hypothetical protein